MTEQELQKELCDLLNSHGIPFCRARMDRRSRITRGWPDFTFAFNGQFVSWEAKVGKGTLAKEQADLMFKILSHGGRARVIRSIDEAIQHLKILKKEQS